MNSQEAREYVEYRLAEFTGKGADIQSDMLKQHQFCNKVTMVINELMMNHGFLIMSDFDNRFRLLGLSSTEKGMERVYVQFNR